MDCKLGNLALGQFKLRDLFRINNLIAGRQGLLELTQLGHLSC